MISPVVIVGRAKLMPVPMPTVEVVILVVCVYQHRCYCATAIDIVDDAMAVTLLVNNMMKVLMML